MWKTVKDLDDFSEYYLPLYVLAKKSIVKTAARQLPPPQDLARNENQTSTNTSRQRYD